MTEETKEVQAEPNEAEKKALNEENSQLGRKFKDYREQMEARLAQFEERERNTQAALEQTNALLQSFAQKDNKVEEDDDPDGGFITKNNIMDYFSKYEKEKIAKESEGTKKYQSDYQNSLRKVIASDNLNLSSDVIELMKQDLKSGTKSYEQTYTGDADIDAKLNYKAAESAVLARKLAGKDHKFREEVGVGLGIAGPDSSSPQKSLRDVKVSEEEINHIMKIKPNLSRSEAEEWGKKIKKRKQEEAFV